MTYCKHTFAPWDVNADFDEDGIVPHVYVLHNARDASHEIVRANEALISAAPELLFALTTLLSLAEEKGLTRTHAASLSRDAITKATTITPGDDNE